MDPLSPTMDASADFVPILDISPIFGSDSSALDSLLSQVRFTMENVGFFQIRGHNFPQQVRHDFCAKQREFFDLDEAKKSEVSMSASYPYGYEAHEVLSAGFSAEEKAQSFPDLKETFSFSLHEGLNGEFPTRFPSNAHFKEKNFETVAKKYYESCSDLAKKILEIFALALHLPRNWFADKVDKHQSALRMLNYPHQDMYNPDVCY